MFAPRKLVENYKLRISALAAVRGSSDQIEVVGGFEAYRMQFRMG